MEGEGEEVEEALAGETKSPSRSGQICKLWPLLTETTFMKDYVGCR